MASDIRKQRVKLYRKRFEAAVQKLEAATTPAQKQAAKDELFALVMSVAKLQKFDEGGE